MELLNFLLQHYTPTIDGKIIINKSGKYRKFHIDHKGYYLISYLVGDRSGSINIHRLVAAKYIPNPNNYPQVNHINGDKLDNRVENLEWCTNQMNKDHAMKLLEGKTGKRTVQAKLTMDDVRYIRSLDYKSITQKSIALKYNVTTSCICYILKNKTYIEATI